MPRMNIAFFRASQANHDDAGCAAGEEDISTARPFRSLYSAIAGSPTASSRKWRSSEISIALLISAVTLGTPTPTQAQGFAEVDQRADEFAATSQSSAINRNSYTSALVYNIQTCPHLLLPTCISSPILSLELHITITIYSPRALTPTMASRFDPSFTPNVIAAIGPKADDRTRQVFTSLFKHVHDFAREVELTMDEWTAGMKFLDEVGHMYFTSDKTRHEMHRISDVIGLES